MKRGTGLPTVQGFRTFFDKRVMVALDEHHGDEELGWPLQVLDACERLCLSRRRQEVADRFAEVFKRDPQFTASVLVAVVAATTDPQHGDREDLLNRVPGLEEFLRRRVRGDGPPLDASLIPFAEIERLLGLTRNDADGDMLRTWHRDESRRREQMINRWAEHVAAFERWAASCEKLF